MTANLIINCYFQECDVMEDGCPVQSDVEPGMWFHRAYRSTNTHLYMFRMVSQPEYYLATVGGQLIVQHLPGDQSENEDIRFVVNDGHWVVKWAKFSNPTMHLPHIPQCTTLWTEVCISVFLLWDMWQAIPRIYWTLVALIIFIVTILLFICNDLQCTLPMTMDLKLGTRLGYFLRQETTSFRQVFAWLFLVW